MDTREKFYQGSILRVGEILQEGSQILDRRANHIVAINGNGRLVDMSIDDAHAKILNEDVHSIPHSFVGVPEDIASAIEPFIAEAKDQYNVTVCLRGIAVLASNKGDKTLLEAIQTRVNTFAPTVVLEGLVGASGRVNGVTESDLIRLINADYFVLTESISEYAKKLERLKPEDVDHLANKIKDFADIVHHYHDDELIHVVTEHISRMERIHKALVFRRSEPMRERAKKMAMKRLSSPSKIAHKAHKAAIELIKEKIAHKKLATMTIEEKERLEDMIAKRKDLVDRLARKLIPKIREIEKDRVFHKHVEEGMNRTADADDEEEVIVVNGKDVIRKHPSGAVYSDGGIKTEDEVSV
jgi:hypothetical protein